MSLRQTYRPRAAFTLIEIMVVCAIIGIIMTISIPSISRQLHPESMQKAVTDIIEACEEARGQAVLTRTQMKLVIRPAEKQFQVTQAHGGGSSRQRLASENLAGEEWRMDDRPPVSGNAASKLSNFKLADRIMIEGIGLHKLNYTEDEVVEVNFYENGTCDEFHIVLASSEGEARMIALEVATAVPAIESDRQKFVKK
jgi:prepilin-type N-terminal cleavage/methylation domain-containing protein